MTPHTSTAALPSLPSPREPTPPATHHDRTAALALARAILPAGRVFPGADEATLEAVERLVGEGAPAGPRYLHALARALDRLALLRTGHRFQRLDAGAQEALLRRWEHDPAARLPLFAFASLLKVTHFDRPEIYRAMGCVYEKGGPAEDAPWLRQVRVADTVRDGESTECDVVVVGTGAGGAVVGKELAERGYAVIFLEEGELHRRDSFTGSAVRAHSEFYRGKARIVALGNTAIPVLMGRLVGGSTAINTGTCFRTPPWILERWCEELGTDDLSEAALRPHFERVERQLQVETARAEYLGGVARVVARGCDRLGWHHFPLRRNAPACDGQGVCDFGCPTEARRSTNVSYVPPALARGALLHTGTRAERVLLEHGRAVGVEARTRHGARLVVRARAVILAGGAVPTPLLLLGQGLANGSGHVGRNLSIHPSTALSALFDEPILGYNAIPQGYGSDEFHRKGILLLGASAPLNVGALAFSLTGRRLMECMEAFDRVASFGVMVEDERRGRVGRAADGSPRLTYFLGKEDVARLQEGMVRVGEIFLAAGARRLFPLLPRVPALEGRADLDRFREKRLRPWDFLLTSFHPIGTCRMGRDPRTSVVDASHQAHEVPGLYIVDGSSVPGPPAVNPQLTIMALADRAAGKIAERLG